MSDIYSEYCYDQEQYARLCLRFGEKERHTALGNLDCYGKHAEALKKKAEQEDRRDVK